MGGKVECWKVECWKVEVWKGERKRFACSGYKEWEKGRMR